MFVALKLEEATNTQPCGEPSTARMYFAARALRWARPSPSPLLLPPSAAVSVVLGGRVAARGLASGPFTVYCDEKEADSKAALATFEESDAPYTTFQFLKRAPKEDELLRVASVLQGGAELMLRDNSWPRVTNPEEIAGVCANNPALLQRPIVVAPDGSTAVTVPLAADSAELVAWIESQDYTPRSEDEEEGDEAAGGPPGPVDSFYGDMAAAAEAEEELVDDDGVDPSDAAEALKAMVQMMDEEQMREAAEMLDVKSQDLDSADLDSLDEEQLRSLLLHILDDTIDRLK
eukprot:COSAG04_NODE_1651_length_6050_cov_5.379768_1_plen_290_part_00